MALMAGLGILAAGVVVIASRKRDEAPVAGGPFEAVRLASELIRLRMDGDDSATRRRALRSAAGKLPDSSLSRAMAKFASGNLPAAAEERPESPFAFGLRGWILIELGRRPEAAEALAEALKDTPKDWEFRPLFEAVQAKAR